MAKVSGQASSLYDRLRPLQRGVPLAASLAVLVYGFVEHGLLALLFPIGAVLFEIMFYSCSS